MDFICLCAEHKAANNETFLISDDSDLSTAEITSLIGKSLNIRTIILPIPLLIIRLLFKLLGKDDYRSRLLGNLSVDVTKNKELLGWKPRFSVQDGFYRSFRK